MFKRSSPPPALLDFIKTREKFIIAGHTEPDADCIGSALALASLLRRLNKEVILCSAGPFKRKEVAQYENLFLAKTEEAQRKGAAVIVVDCGGRDRIGEELEKELEGLPFVIIDHHRTGTNKNAVSYVDADAPSTTALILPLFEAFDMPLTQEEASLLFLGLCTDTGFFRHIAAGGAEVFGVAEKLVASGADPKKTFNIMKGGMTLNSRLLLGVILSRVTPYFGGKLLLSSEKLGETKRFGRKSRDSDTLYELLMGVEGVEAAVVIREESKGNCTVGFRSRDSWDVGSIAAALGGGGHKNAAGLIKKGSIKELETAILGEFERYLRS